MWWTYEFCHESHIRQYHLPASSSTSKSPLRPNLDYTLARYSADVPPTSFIGPQPHTGPAGSTYISTPDATYLRQYWGMGTVCDMTGNERVVEVQFHCCEEEHVSSVREMAVCVYVLSVHTPKVCGVFKELKKRREVAKAKDVGYGDIVCEPIVEEIAAGGAGHHHPTATASIPSTTSLSTSPAPTPTSTSIPMIDYTHSRCTSPLTCTITPRKPPPPAIPTSPKFIAKPSPKSTEQKGKATKKEVRVISKKGNLASGAGKTDEGKAKGKGSINELIDQMVDEYLEEYIDALSYGGADEDEEGGEGKGVGKKKPKVKSKTYKNGLHVVQIDGRGVRRGAADAAAAAAAGGRVGGEVVIDIDLEDALGDVIGELQSGKKTKAKKSKENGEEEVDEFEGGVQDRIEWRSNGKGGFDRVPDGEGEEEFEERVRRLLDELGMGGGGGEEEGEEGRGGGGRFRVGH
ncbi:Protein OS-9 [Rhizophlyctis rosea]|nr:Protein OS-9 [Rhizophlyctis rosea]